MDCITCIAGVVVANVIVLDFEDFGRTSLIDATGAIRYTISTCPRSSKDRATLS